MRAFFLFLFLFIPSLVFAESVTTLGKGGNLGLAASNINDIIAFIYSIIDIILYIAASILGMSGFMKYRLHRRNPQQVTLSTVVTELSIAAVFVLIAVMVQMSASYDTVAEPALPAPTISPSGATQYPTGGYPR